ncbi:MAG: hypothetical protein FJW23_05025 [Acidimicrobiia bacterium]|nr:hypothetical protein [Acidimicrobiia bacterium]
MYCIRDRDDDRWKSGKVEKWKSKVGSWKSEVGSKWEVGSGKWEVGIHWEVRVPRPSALLRTFN